MTEIDQMKLPMVEIFETVEGEGTRAGYPTTFVRLFHCNLRCTWCDTTYSYAPAKPVFYATIPQIVQEVTKFPNKYICLTGGEPLIHGVKSECLITELAKLEDIEDIHIETNGAISLAPFQRLREREYHVQKKVRFILDYKLPSSGEQAKMISDNFRYLTDEDEIKFVIQDKQDFDVALDVLNTHYRKGTPLFSPVWGTLPPEKIVKWMLEHDLTHARLSLQIHKLIWDPEARGV